MLPEERRLQIVEQMRAKPLVRADELADRFGVSIETVRRDLLALQRDGLVRRVYGGATVSGPRALEPSFDRRRSLHLERKHAIARLAASLVQPGDTLMLDMGTSIAAMAGALPPGHHGTVLTNSLLVAAELAGRDGIELQVSGGRVRSGDLSCSGSHAEAFFADFYADKAFVGSGGVHPEAGLTDYHLDEVSTRRVILEHAAERYALADSSKLGQVAVRKVSALERLSAVITDDQAEPAIMRALQDKGVRLLVAPVGAAQEQTG